MNAKQANRISIRNYLSSIGINPVRRNKSSSLYLAPYRAETAPSLKVSHDHNIWVDYGNDNKGGTLIDLVLQIHPSYSVSDAIRAIEKSTQSFFSFQKQKSQEHCEIQNTKNESRNAKHKSDKTKDSIQNTNNEISGLHYEKIRVRRINEIGENAALNAYLKSRGIDPDTAEPYCKEIYYAIGDRLYFGIGNQNDRGWSIRNKYWKGCTAQGYSYYKNGFEKLCVFEGIFDLLSYLEMNKQSERVSDFLVLNSLVNLKKTISILKEYSEVSLFLDRDPAGRKATELIIKSNPQSRDESDLYRSHKDFNDYYLIKHKEQLLIVEEPLLKKKQPSKKLFYGPRVYEASHVLARPKRLLR